MGSSRSGSFQTSALAICCLKTKSRKKSHDMKGAQSDIRTQLFQNIIALYVVACCQALTQTCYIRHRVRDKAVNITNRHGAGRTRVRSLLGARDYFFFKPVQTRPCSPSSLFSWTMGLFPRAKRPEGGNDHPFSI